MKKIYKKIYLIKNVKERLMKAYEAVVFDLDGTLLNTLDDLCDSVNYALAKKGFQARSLEEVRCFVGNGVEKLMMRAVPDETTSEEALNALEIFKEHYKVNSKNKTRPYEGIMELLRELKDKGFKMAIVSNKFNDAVKELNAEFFGEYIEYAYGECETIRKKPNPDAVFKALEDLGVEKHQAVYVGDSDVDIMTAQNSGLDCISVSWGFRTRQELEMAGAVSIIEEPMDLMDIIYKMC